MYEFENGISFFSLCVEVKAEESASVINVSVCQDQSTRDLHVKIVRYE